MLAVALLAGAVPRSRAAEPTVVLPELPIEVAFGGSPWSIPVPVRPGGDFALEVHVAPSPDWSPRNQAIGITLYQPNGGFVRASASYWDGWYTVIVASRRGQPAEVVTRALCPAGTPGFKEGFRLRVVREGARVTAAIDGAAPIQADALAEPPIAVALEVECFDPIRPATCRVARVTHESLRPGTPPGADPTGWIVFSRTVASDGQRRYHLFLTREDGSAARQLTTGAFDARAPAFSPDGKAIAYEGHEGERSDIYVVPVEGGTPTRVTTTGDCRAPRWSPDGKHLIYARVNPQGARLYLAPAASGGQDREVAVAFGNCGDLAPDATEIASAHLVKVQDQVVWRLILTPRGERSDPARFRWFYVIPDRSVAVRSLDWSPDGRQILFTVAWSGGSHVRVVTSDGKIPREFPLQRGALLGRPRDACWSPDGEAILYVASLRQRGTNGELYVMDRDGRRTRLLLEPEGDADYTDPDWWRPGYVAPLSDGTRIVLLNGRYVVKSSRPQLIPLNIATDRDFRLEVEVLPNPAYTPRRQAIGISVRMRGSEVYAGYLDYPDSPLPRQPRTESIPYLQIKGRTGLSATYANLGSLPLGPEAPTFASGFLLVVTRRGPELSVTVDGREVYTLAAVLHPVEQVRLLVESSEVEESPLIVVRKIVYRPLGPGGPAP